MEKSATPSCLGITEADAARELRKLQPFLESSDHSADPAKANQLPVKPRLQASGDVGVQMGWPPLAREDLRLARNSLLLSLQLAVATARDGIHYSRNRNDYTQLKHNHPDYWTYNNMRAAVDSLLTRPKLVCEFRARPQNPYAPSFTRQRSALFVGPDFIDAIRVGADAVSEVAVNDERILLRDGHKRALPIQTGPIINDTMRFLDLFDGAVAGLHVSFSDSEIRWLSKSLAVASVDGRKVLINTERRRLTRIFTRTFTDGGRFYRGFWQEVPKKMRSSILIDGAATAEHDYASCHLRLAYFAVGQKLAMSVDGADHYTLDGFGPEWRKVIKRSVSILLNARTYRGAVGAISCVREMPEAPWAQRVAAAIALVDAIMARHDALAPLWHTGCGLGLQFIDSQLALACATELIGRGIVPLPIHDSMLVCAEHLPDLNEVMERRFEEDGPQLAASRFEGVAMRKARRFRGHDLTLGGTADALRALARRGPPCRPSPPPPGAAPASPSWSPGLSKPVPAVSTDGPPPDPAPLLADPIILDLERVIAHRKWVPAGLVRGALLSAASLYPCRGVAARAVSAWIAQIVTVTSAAIDDARAAREVIRFINRKPRPITAAAIARLSGVSTKMALQLGPAVVVPIPRTPTLSRRTRRMATTLPRIINIEAASPWGSPEKRASWFIAHPNAVDRQVEALKAVLAAGDLYRIATARASYVRAASERAALSSETLAVDRLLAELRFVLAVYDPSYRPVPPDNVDVAAPRRRGLGATAPKTTSLPASLGGG